MSDLPPPWLPPDRSNPLPPGVTVIPTYPLYSAGQIAAATFLGSTLGGGWLLARNYKRLGEPRKAVAALLLGIAAVAVLTAIAALVPGPTSFLGIGAIAGMAAIARSLQGERFDRHLALGGPRASSWSSVGIGAASLGMVGSAIMIGAIGYAVVAVPDRVDFGDSSVMYDDGGTRAEAQAVGDLLTQLNYLSADKDVTVEVVRDHGRAVVVFVVNDRAFSDEAIQHWFHERASGLSAAAFGNAPVDVWLSDPLLEPHVKLRWEARPDASDSSDDHTK